MERSSPKNSSPSRHSPPRPHCSFPATVDQPRDQGLHQHPADEGVGVGLAEQDPDQPGRLLALDPARGAPHVLDEVAGRGTGRRAGCAGPEDEEGQAGIAAGDVPERPDGGAGAADRSPLGGHLVDEGDTRFRGGW